MILLLIRLVSCIPTDSMCMYNLSRFHTTANDCTALASNLKHDSIISKFDSASPELAHWPVLSSFMQPCQPVLSFIVFSIQELSLECIWMSLLQVNIAGKLIQ